METSKAPDGGWGYACVIGTFQSQMLFGLAVRTFGVLYLLTLERFETTATIVSWVGAVNMLFWGAFSPIASILCRKYGCRQVAALGSVLQCIGFIISGFANHILMVYLGFSVMVGCGTACTAISGYLIVSLYFNKKRAIATAIASSGASFAVFVMPPLVNFLATYYGYQGCLIILSGITLQGLVSAGLFRPLVTRHNVVLVSLKNINDKDDTTGKPTVHDAKTSQGNETANFKIIEEQLNGSKDHPSVQSISGHLQDKGTKDTTIQELQTGRYEPYVDNTNSHVKSKTENQEVTESSDSRSGSNCCGLKNKIQLLKEEPVLIGMFIASFSITGVSSVITAFTPAFAIERGSSQSEAVLLISFAGITDIIARISLGFVLDSRCIRPWRIWVYCILGLVTSIPMITLPLVSHYWWYSLSIVLIHVTQGSVFGQRTTVLADILGVKRMTAAFGLVQLANSVGFVFGIGFGGVMRDQFGTYEYNFYIAGIINLFGFTCMMLLYRYKQVLNRRHR